MKTYYSLFCSFLILSTSCLFAQRDTLNQSDQFGQKFGYWKHFDDSGNIESEGRYMMLHKPMSPEELFMFGLKSTKTGEWKYYNQKGKIVKIEYWNFGRFKWMDEISYNDGKIERKSKKQQDHYDYDYKLNEQINKFEKKTPYYMLEVSPPFYCTEGRTGSSETAFFTIFSYFEKEVSINYYTNSENIKFREKFSKIKPKQKLDIPFSLKFIKGKSESQISISYFYKDTINHIINIYNLGYDLSTSDFELTQSELRSFEIKKGLLHLFRGTEECELKIYPYYHDSEFDKIKDYKIKETAVYPLSLEFNKINVRHLPKDRYLFRIVNYRDKIDRFAIVNLK